MSRIKRAVYANPLNGNRRPVGYWRHPRDDYYYVLTQENDTGQYRLTHHFYTKDNLQTSKQCAKFPVEDDDARAMTLAGLWLLSHNFKYKPIDIPDALFDAPDKHLPDTFDECVRDKSLRYITAQNC